MTGDKLMISGGFVLLRRNSLVLERQRPPFLRWMFVSFFFSSFFPSSVKLITRYNGRRPEVVAFDNEPDEILFPRRCSYLAVMGRAGKGRRPDEKRRAISALGTYSETVD